MTKGIKMGLIAAHQSLSSDDSKFVVVTALYCYSVFTLLEGLSRRKWWLRVDLKKVLMRHRPQG